MSFPRYPEYKDSGAEWLGKVPAHWTVSPFKWQIKANDGGAWGDDAAGDNDTYVLRSTDQTVDGHWRIAEPALRHLGVKERLSTLLKCGDLVVTKSSGSSFHIGKTTLVNELIASKGFGFGNFMQRIQTKPSFNPKLAWYVLNNNIARLQLDLLSNSTTGLANLNGTIIGEILVATPPSAEQAAIVSFLDHEIARIDALIEEQRCLIELLKEKRQAVISHAVTKGLDPDVPMKDSGVEWLGEVPAHWAVTKVAYHYEVVLGKMLDERRITGKHLAPYLRNTDVQWDQINLERLPLMDFSPADRKKYELKEGDLLVCEGGEVGRAAIWDGQKAECYYQKALHRMRPLRKDLEVPRFMFYLLWHASEQGRFTSMEGKSTIAHLPAETLRQYQFPFPPKGEQENIVFYLERINSEMDKLVEEAEHSIHLLSERRSALISTAVTGKIDVRDWQQSAGESVPAEGTQKVTA